MKGFSLMELLVVIGILALLLVVAGGLNLFRYSSRRNLQNTVIEIAALARDAQNRSLTRQDRDGDGQGDRWGVRFENGGEDSVKIFSNFYAPDRVSEIYVLRRGLNFDIPAEGGAKDIIFFPVSGLPDNSFTVKISLTGDPSVFSEININSNGTIQY